MVSYGDYNFGQRFKFVLDSRHIMATKFAKRMGVSHGTVFRLFSMKSVDLDRIRQISMLLQHDFIAEIAETGNGMKGLAQLQASLEQEQAAKAAMVLAHEERLKDLLLQLQERQRKIAQLELEVGYLKEVIEAYKK